MKKNKSAVIILLCMVLAMGCNNSNDENTENPLPVETGDNDASVQGTALDFFPFLENTQYVYSGNNQYAEQEAYATIINENKMQRKVSALGYESTEVLEYANGAVTVVYAESRWYLYNDLTDAEHNFNKVLLKEPIQLGNSWDTYSGSTSVGNLKGTSTITAVNVPVETDYGTFEAIEVSTQYEGVNYEIEYFVKGIGLVKSEYYTQSVGNDKYTSNKADVTMELTELNENTAVDAELFLYYPNDDADYFEVEEAAFSFRTNDAFETHFEELLKESFDNGSVLLTANSKINSIEVDLNNDCLTLDLSQDFIHELNAGSGYEKLLIESLALTFSDFYNVTNFRITIDGDNYSSGHLTFQEDEYLSIQGILTQYEDAEEAEE